MPPEILPERNKKKFPIPAVIAVLLVVTTIFFFIKYREAPPGEIPALPASAEPTEAEKLLKSQSEAMDKLRAQYLTATSTNTTLIENQVKSIDALRKQASKQKTVAALPRKTIDQQTQAIDALRAAVYNK